MHLFSVSCSMCSLSWQKHAHTTELAVKWYPHGHSVLSSLKWYLTICSTENHQFFTSMKTIDAHKLMDGLLQGIYACEINRVRKITSRFPSNDIPMTSSLFTKPQPPYPLSPLLLLLTTDSLTAVAAASSWAHDSWCTLKLPSRSLAVWEVPHKS